MADPRRAPRPVVFLGPSLSLSAAERLLTADYRPPAKKGDVYALVASDVETVVLIDGLFHHQPAVWPREILTAIDEGIRVIGASSIGALRAAELHTFGMEGVGVVFDWFRTGHLDGDDEVALLHDPETYRARSEPLVNIRWTLLDAERRGLLSTTEREEIVSDLKALPYSERQRLSILATQSAARLSAERRNRLFGYLQTHFADIKRSDAEAALRHAATPDPQPDRSRGVPPLDGEPLSYRAQGLWMRKIAGTDDSVRQALEDAKRRHPALASRERLAARWFARDLIASRGVVPPSPFVTAFLRDWSDRYGNNDPDSMMRQGLSARERHSFLNDAAALAWALTQKPGSLMDPVLCREIAGLESLLRAQSETSGVDPFLLPEAGAADCPRSSLIALVAGWGVEHGLQDVPADECFGALGTTGSLQSTAAHRLACWLISVGPERFGCLWDPDYELALELQATGKLVPVDQVTD